MVLQDIKPSRYSAAELEEIPSKPAIERLQSGVKYKHLSKNVIKLLWIYTLLKIKCGTLTTSDLPDNTRTFFVYPAW